MPPGRAARPEDCVLSRARSSFATNAPCVLASERPSHPGDEHRSAKPSYTLTPYASVKAFSAYESEAYAKPFSPQSVPQLFLTMNSPGR
jgi:hypothetical protein